MECTWRQLDTVIIGSDYIAIGPTDYNKQLRISIQWATSHMCIYSRVPGPLTALLVPITSTTAPKLILAMVHCTVCPLRFSTVPWPSTVKAGSSLQSHSRLFWRVKTLPVLIIELHSPGCGRKIRVELMSMISSLSYRRFVITVHHIPRGSEQK